jgi:hypothetical protein
MKSFNEWKAMKEAVTVTPPTEWFTRLMQVLHGIPVFHTFAKRFSTKMPGGREALIDAIREHLADFDIDAVEKAGEEDERGRFWRANPLKQRMTLRWRENPELPDPSDPRYYQDLLKHMHKKYMIDVNYGWEDR